MQEALVDMVQQHCLEPSGLLDDGALSANEDALLVLERYELVQPAANGRWSWVSSGPKETQED